MKKIGFIVGFGLLPFFALAQVTFDSGGTLTNFFDGILKFVNNTVMPLLIAFAVIMFIWGVIKFFILGGADQEKRDSGKQLMMWGLLGFVLIVGLYGIIGFLLSVLGISTGGTIDVPDVPTGN